MTTNEDHIKDRVDGAGHLACVHNLIEEILEMPEGSVTISVTVPEGKTELELLERAHAEAHATNEHVRCIGDSLRVIINMVEISERSNGRYPAEDVLAEIKRCAENGLAGVHPDTVAKQIVEDSDMPEELKQLLRMLGVI